MITTNVDRAIQMLDEKGHADVKEVAKALGAKQDSIDLIFSYLEEEGLVELKYGVFHTIASLKKQVEKKKKKFVKKVEEELEEVPEEEEEKPEILQQKPELKPKPLEKAKPAAPKIAEKPKPDPFLQKPLEKSKPELKQAPKQLKPAVLEKPKPELKPAETGIPKFDEAKGSKIEKKSARLANMMIKLLEKSEHIPSEEKQKAEIVMKDILKLAKQNKIYAQKTPVTAEFTLCSLLLSADILEDKFNAKKDIETANKMQSTYNLILKSAKESNAARIKHYSKKISAIHSIIIKDAYPLLKQQEKKKKAEVEKAALAREKTEELEQRKAELKARIADEKKKLESKTKLIEKPKPAVPKPAEIPKFAKDTQEKKAIPRFDTLVGTKDEQNAAKLANTMLTLLEKFYALPKKSRQNAILVLNDVMKLAKQNNVYVQKTPVTAEFILCSLIIGVETLISEHEGNIDANISQRINSTYHLIREVSMEIDKSRLKYYMGLIHGVYKGAMAATFSSKGA